jgi:hypothetical protein
MKGEIKAIQQKYQPMLDQVTGDIKEVQFNPIFTSEI